MQEQTEHSEAPVTKEEMLARQVEIQEHYESQLPFLETQKKYQTLIVELEELDVRRARAAVMLAQIMAPPVQEQHEQDEPKARKLRKEE